MNEEANCAEESSFYVQLITCFLAAFEVYPARDLIQTQDFIYQLYQKEKSQLFPCFLNSNLSLNCPSTMWLYQKFNLSSAKVYFTADCPMFFNVALLIPHT